MLETSCNIAGVILAGGQSSRMGVNKAELEYAGTTLLNHMIIRLKKAGVAQIYISGYEAEGYPFIPDRHRYYGPAFAVRDVMTFLKGKAEKIIFLPVDMPLINTALIQNLVQQKKGGYFAGWPLPMMILNGEIKEGEKASVREFLKDQNVPELTIPDYLKACFINANTPQEWEAIKIK